MKRLTAFICVVVMACSLAACASPTVTTMTSDIPAATTAPPATEAPTPSPSPTPSPTPEPTPSPEPEDPEVTEYNQAKQAILDHIDVAYTGLTAEGAPMYFMASSDGEYVALVMENTDKKRYVKFIGSAVRDEATGILTVTDSDKGYTFGFIEEQQADGSFFLDCGNLGECYLEQDEPGNVVDYIFMTFRNKTDATDDLIYAMTLQSVMDYIDYAYLGLTAADGWMYFLVSEEGDFAALVLESEDETSYIKFIGSATIDENGLTTVTDSNKGYRFGFYAEDMGDDSYFLDCGDLGECYLEVSDTETIVGYLNETFANMTDVTDAFMAEYGR